MHILLQSLELPDDLADPEVCVRWCCTSETQVLARDTAFVMGTASRFVCEPWRWVGHLYVPWLTQVHTGVCAAVLACLLALCASTGVRCMHAAAMPS